MSIPKHWQLKNLGEACVVIMGQSPPSSTYNEMSVGLPFFQGKAEFTEKYPIPKKHCSKPNKIALENDILLSVRAPVGATNIANQKCCIGRGLAAIRFDDNKYLFYYLLSIKKLLDKQGTGTTFNAISGKQVRSILFPLPPLTEQRAIVAKIEMLLSELDNGITNLKEAKAKLVIYRQAVLKKAFQGELTGEKINVPTVMLGSVVSIVSGSTPQGLSDVKGTGDIQFYKVSDMNLSGNEKEMRRSNISLNNNDLNSLKIKTYPKGTVIFPKRGGAIHTNKKRILFKEASFDLNLMGLVPNNNYLSKYLYYYMMSIDLSVICDGSNVPQINTKNIYPLEFPSCSVDEQKKIIEAIETRFSVADKLEESMDESSVKAEALRQSILKQAFEGKLLRAEELGQEY